MDTRDNRRNYQQIKNCRIGKNTKIWSYVNLFGCRIGNDCMIGAFVEIQSGAVIGDKVRVQSHSFICEGVTVEDEVFIGHHVVFINDKFPRVTNPEGKMRKYGEWTLLRIKICKRAAIGSNATIMGGVTIGKNSLIGAGAVVLKDVPANSIAAGNPAKVVGEVEDRI